MWGRAPLQRLSHVIPRSERQRHESKLCDIHKWPQILHRTHEATISTHQDYYNFRYLCKVIERLFNLFIGLLLCFVVNYAEDMSVKADFVIFECIGECFPGSLLLEEVGCLLVSTSRICEEKQVMGELLSLFGRLKHLSFYRLECRRGCMSALSLPLHLNAWIRDVQSAKWAG